MQSSLSVVTPATSISLLSINEAMLGLNMSKSTDVTAIDQIELMVRWSSDEIAAMCNRVFAQEEVIEVFREIDSIIAPNKIYLSRYPVVANSLTVEDDGGAIDSADYELEASTGTLRRLDSAFIGPVTARYVGGYKLPTDAPPALKQACMLMSREAYYAASRGDATTRMISHKETRIIYFDPNAKGGAGAAGAGGSAARRAVNDLLKRYMRFWV